MPTITEKLVPLWAFCPDGGCPGYETQEVEGVAREVSRSVLEEGAERPPFPNAESTSFVQYLVPSGETDEHGYSIAAELQCEYCERTLQVSSTPRPEYAPISGVDPMALLNKREEAKRASSRDVELAELRGQLAALMAVQQPAKRKKADPVEEEAA